MAKVKSQFVCQSCGAGSAKWLGRCNTCGEWNTLVEEKLQDGGDENLASLRDDLKDMGPNKEKSGWVPKGGPAWAPLEGEDEEGSEERLSRLTTGIGELDRVLGGGMVRDSFVLLGGDPGIGKSTLLLQMARGLVESDSKNRKKLKVFYVSGEESMDQIRARADRLGVKGNGQIFLGSETEVERVFASVKELRPDVVIVDSVQTFTSNTLTSAPGSVSQVREVSARLMTLAKAAGVSVWLVGHVTKDGNIAGPKVIEHMVDTVLYFEGEGGVHYRLLRAVKNRFGSARELGVFEMVGDGLAEVANPSSLFMSERSEPVEGTAVGTSLEGSRPLLVELQALVNESPLSMPRRTAVGIDSNRVALLAAILERHLDLPLSKHDLFFNVAGGLRLGEPACDLAAAAAIWSSSQRRLLPSSCAFIGELGLTGEVRRVNHPEVRVDECKKLGMKAVVLPKANIERVGAVPGIEIHGIQHLSELPKLSG